MAVIQFKNLLKEDPNYLPARIELGRAHLRAGDAGSAEKELRLALAMGASREQVFPLLGNALLAQRRYSQLLETIKSPVPGDAGDYVIQLLRARAMFELGQLDNARDAFEMAHKLRPTRSDPIVGLAQVAQLQGRLDTATELIKQALALSPRSAEALLRQGDILRDRGDVTGALASYDRAVSVSPTSSRARLARTSLRLEQNDLDGALEDIRVVRERHPDDIASRFLLWQINTRLGDGAAAKQDLLDLTARLNQYDAKAINSEPLLLRITAISSYANGNPDRSAASLERYGQLKPNDTSMRRMHGEVLLAMGDARQALEKLQPLARLFPRDAELATLLGRAYMRVGRYNSANEMFEKARQLAPDDPGLLSRIALSEIGSGNFDEAMSGLLDAVEQGKSDLSAAMLLGVLQVKSGAPERALNTLEAHVKSGARSTKFMNLLGIARAATGNLVTAREAFEQAQNLAPGYLPPAYNLARLDLAAGNVQGAIARLEKVVDRYPRAEAALLALADIALQRGDRDDAVRWLDRAAAASPEDVPTQARLVDLQLSLGRAAEALQAATRMTDKHPENAVAMETLARAETANGKHAQAQKNLRDAARYAGFDGALLIRIASRQVALEDFEEARRTLVKAINSSSSDEALTTLIRLEIRTGNIESARQRIAGMRKDDTSSAMADILTAEAHLKQNRFANAAEAYRAAQAKLPSTAGILGLSSALQANGDAKGATSVLEAWCSEHASDRLALTRLAFLYLPQRRFDEARPLFEKLVDNSPDDPALLVNLARIYQVQGDSRARPTAERARLRAPMSPSVLDTLGWIMVTEQDAAGGLSLLRDALAREDNPLIRYHVAQALTELGRDAEAKAELELIIQGGQPADLVRDVKQYYEKVTARR